MTDNSHSANFDWVTARYNCSPSKEFHHLMTLVKENCMVLNRCLPEEHSYHYKFQNKDSDNFSVERTESPMGKCVVGFALKTDGILVGGSDSKPEWKMKLTLTLNDDGECRFRIDGSGEYMRWQVACRALSPIFFDEPRNPTGSQ